MSVAADFSAVMEKNLGQRVLPLSYISLKNLENFNEFFKFSESSADNVFFIPQEMGEDVNLRSSPTKSCRQGIEKVAARTANADQQRFRRINGGWPWRNASYLPGRSHGHYANKD